MLSVNPLCSEALLQYIWLSGLFDLFNLTTITGEPVTIFSPGQLNRDGGPDFTAARLRIGGMEWVGNVELHYRTSDWRRHGHHYNPKYHNVILHVVFEHDMKEVKTHKDGKAFSGKGLRDMPGILPDIPVLELQHRIPKVLLRRYHHLMANAAFVPCAPLLYRVSGDTWQGWKTKLIEERLLRKTEVYRNWLEQTRFNWEEVSIRAMAQGYGMPVNTAAFLELVQSIPFMLLARVRLDRLRLEALLFGQAGMLETVFNDEYPQQLQTEYRFLQHKHGLQPMAPYRWQWLRMRPASFPSLRLAYFAAILHTNPHFFSRLLDAESTSAFENLLDAVPADYWQYHYRLDVPSVRTAGPGTHILHHVMINTIAPLLFLYGKHMRMPQYERRALRLLEELPAENNHIIRGWKEERTSESIKENTQEKTKAKTKRKTEEKTETEKTETKTEKIETKTEKTEKIKKAGKAEKTREAEEKIGIKTARDSQSLLQLKQYYCDHKRCLECRIGRTLLEGGED